MYVPHPLPVKEESEIKPLSVAARRHRRNRAIRNFFTVLLPIVIAKNPDQKHLYNQKGKKITEKQRKKKRRASRRKSYKKNRQAKLEAMRVYKQTPKYKEDQKARRNTPEYRAKRQERRRKEKEEREELLASMGPGTRRKFLNEERQARKKMAKAKKIKKALDKIQLKKMAAEKIQSDAAQQSLKKRLEREQYELHCKLVDKAIRKIKGMAESRKLRLAQLGKMSIDVIEETLQQHNRIKTDEELRVDQAIECVLEMRVSRQAKRNSNGAAIMQVHRSQAA